MSEYYTRYLVSESTSGGKYWELEVRGTVLRTRYGALGQSKKWTSKSYPTYAKALAEGRKKMLSKVHKGYTLARRPPTVNKRFNPADLATTSMLGEFYFRALDRFPGGNADMFTIRELVVWIPGEPRRHFTQSVSDWDGQQFVGLGARREVADPEDDAFFEAAAAWMRSARGEGDYCVYDRRYDREEYDTEWSWLEFSLFPLPGGLEDLETYAQEPVVARLMQRTSVDAPQASEEASAFMQAVHTLTQISRPEQVSDGGVPGGPNLSLGYHDYEPIMLHVPSTPHHPHDPASPQDALFGELRALLAQPASDAVFSRICRALGDGDVSEEVLVYLEERLEGWGPHVSRDAPRHWVERLCQGARCPAMRLCRHLSYNFVRPSSEELQALTHAPELESLQTLELIGADLDDEDASIVAASAALGNLIGLDLWYNNISGDGAEAIQNSATLPSKLIVHVYMNQWDKKITVKRR